MRTPTDNPPRTASNRYPGEGRLGEFDCELPYEVRTELFRPRRARLLHPPPVPPRKRSWLDYARSWGRAALLLGLGLVFVVALAAIVSWCRAPHPLRQSPVNQTPAVQTPTPTAPTPVVQMPAAPTWTEVRRAELVPVTVKRAALMQLPRSWLGVYRWFELPESVGGGSVYGRYCGIVDRFSDIPKNSIPGDMWVTRDSNVSWVLCVPEGSSRAVWLDP